LPKRKETSLSRQFAVTQRQLDEPTRLSFVTSVTTDLNQAVVSTVATFTNPSQKLASPEHVGQSKWQGVRHRSLAGVWLSDIRFSISASSVKRMSHTSHTRILNPLVFFGSEFVNEFVAT
jgi:hypothetical protein